MTEKRNLSKFKKIYIKKNNNTQIKLEEYKGNHSSYRHNNLQRCVWKKWPYALTFILLFLKEALIWFPIYIFLF